MTILRLKTESPFLFDTSSLIKRVNKMSKTKLSLTEIFNNFVNSVEEEDKKYVKENGFILTISLSGAQEKASKTGATTLVMNNGFVSKSGKDGNHVPFLVSWRGWAIQPDETGKVKLMEFDDLSRNIDDAEVAKDFKGVPINWKFDLSVPLLEEMLGEKSKRGSSNSLWSKFQKFLIDNKKCQLQMLVVKSANPEGVGELKNVTLHSGKSTEVYNIYIPKADIYGVKLLTPCNEYMHKVDRPSSVMEKLKGRVVQENEVSPKTNLAKGLVKSKHKQKQQEELFEEILSPSESSLFAEDESDLDNM
jgi:hypothetical protein